MDVFALGVMLHELVMGSVPFDAGTPADTMSLIRVWPYSPPPELEAAGLGALLRRALARKPAERFADAGELLSELGGWLLARGVSDPRGEAAAYLGCEVPAATRIDSQAVTQPWLVVPSNGMRLRGAAHGWWVRLQARWRR
jgi:serine/threonine-protein kinase